MTTRETGLKAEERAAEYLAGLGYSVLERNYRSRMGEIDIIARDGETVVFVEVRSRACGVFGSPGETVGYWKQNRIIKTAALYAQKKRLDCPMRFDVISIEAAGLQHFPDAFQCPGY